ncbi:MAG: hypothetical protein Kow0069_22080 [Promethearchaeota archaeon]
MNLKAKLLLVAFYIGVLVYVLLYAFVEPVRVAINESQEDIAGWAEKYSAWMYLISIFICFLGSASVVFPVPFPVVLFFFGDALFLRYGGTEATFAVPMFWVEMMGVAILGGLGCALGEVTGYAIGMGAKAVVEGAREEQEEGESSETLARFEALANAIRSNEKSAPWLVFLFALTPLPDDILMIPLGMAKYPWYKCIVPGWLGKTVTTIFYVFWPVLIKLGVLSISGYSQGVDVTAFDSGIVVEAVMMAISVSVIALLLTIDWQKRFGKAADLAQN